MIITCPSCATRYKVPEGVFGAEGRTVRCKACTFEWLAVPDDLPIGEAPEETKPEAARAAPNSPAEFASAKPPIPAIDSAAKRRRRQPSRPAGRRSLLRRITAAAAALALVVVGGHTFRNGIVGAVPATIVVYEAVGLEINLVGLDFENVRVAREFENGLPVLTVAGDVVNVTGDSVNVPRLRFGLRDARQQEIYHWTVAVSEEPLPPDGRARFATKLAAPPAEALDVLLRFNDRQGGRRRQATLIGS